ncbi:MAG: hypothetical protein IJU37_12055 [Desulfovibrio sp.]|nr:hypothetical protein [Desulfovibrio sp.]
MTVESACETRQVEPVRPVFARGLILLLAFCLLLMLGLALKERLFHPEALVVTGPTPMQEPASAAKPDKLGALMRQVAMEPQNMDVLLELVEQLASVQSWEAAETFAQRAVAQDAGNVKAQYLLGVILHNQGRHREAADALERVLTLRDEASARYSLGVLFTYFLNDAPRGRMHWEAGLQDNDASEELKQAIRAELDKLAAKKPSSTAREHK